MTVTLHHGDALDVLRGLADNSVDAVVTDPPYGLSDHDAGDVAQALGCWLRGEEYSHGRGGFMGRTWDAFVPGPSLWREVYRVLKPGGHLLCFAGTRTQDLMGIAIRLAGFECRDTIQHLAWVYGSGFPKSHDVSKAIDKAAGAEREVVGMKPRVGGGRAAPSHEGWRRPWMDEEGAADKPFQLTAPATDAARQWEGWGTALKPAHEPILVFRKPLIGTVAANVLAHGTGGLNIAACRVGTGVETWPASRSYAAGRMALSGRAHGDSETQGTGTPPAGRWPANLCLSHAPGCERVGTRRVRAGVWGATQHTTPGNSGTMGDGCAHRPSRDPGVADADGMETVDEWRCVDGCAVRALGEQSGVSKSSDRADHAQAQYGQVYGWAGCDTKYKRSGGHADTGTAARFFPAFEPSPLDDVTPWLYTAKASRREREAGLEGMEAKVRLRQDLTDEQRAYVLAELEAAGVSL